MFAIGDANDPERTTFSVPASMAEFIRERLGEFIVACESPINGGEHAKEDQETGQDPAGHPGPAPQDT
jgi:hypothetical protein